MYEPPSRQRAGATVPARSTPIAITALLCAVGLAACGGGAGSVDPQATASALRGQLRTYAALYGPGIGVTCPNGVKATTGQRFTCNVAAYGRRYPIPLVVSDTKGNSYRWDFVDETALWTSLGPAHLTCGQLQQGDAWTVAGLQKVRIAQLQDPHKSEQQLALLVGQAYRKVCTGARPDYRPSDDDLAATGPSQ